MVVAALVASLVPVPYVILSPGPTLNTLGQTSGRALITIDGHRTYPTSGHLNLVTVSFLGGPGDGFNVFTAIRAWLTPHTAVVPESELFPPNQSEQQVVQQDTAEMANSQQTAAGRGPVHAGDPLHHRGHHHGDPEGPPCRGRAAHRRQHHRGGRHPVHVHP